MIPAYFYNTTSAQIYLKRGWNRITFPVQPPQGFSALQLYCLQRKSETPYERGVRICLNHVTSDAAHSIKIGGYQVAFQGPIYILWAYAPSRCRLFALATY